MTEAYEKALKAYERAKAKEAVASARRGQAWEALEEARKALPLTCWKCGHSVPIGEIELIDTQTLHQHYDDVHTHHRYSWVCPACPTENGLDPRGGTCFEAYRFPSGYVKQVLVWQLWGGGEQDRHAAALRERPLKENARRERERRARDARAQALDVLLEAGYKVEAPE